MPLQVDIALPVQPERTHLSLITTQCLFALHARVCVCVCLQGPLTQGHPDRSCDEGKMSKSSDGAGVTGFTLNMWNRITLSFEDRYRHDISGSKITRST